VHELDCKTIAHLYSILNVRRPASCSYRTTGKITCFYFNLCTFKWEDNILLT